MRRLLVAALLLLGCAVLPPAAPGETPGDGLERSLQLLQQIDARGLDPASRLELRLGLADGLLADGQAERALFQLSCALQEGAAPSSPAILDRIGAALARLDRHGLAEVAFLYAGTPLAALADARLLRHAAVAEAPAAAGGRALGVLLPLSGRYAAFGQRVQRGLELAQATRASASIPLVFRDTGSDGADPAALVADLAADPTILAIIGPLTSGAAGPAAEQADRERLPLLLLAQREAVAAASPYVFRDALTTTAQIRALLDHAAATRGLTRFAVLHPATRQGEAFADQFAAGLEQRGLRLLARQSYPPAANDLRRELEALARALPAGGGAALEALVIPDGARQVAQIVPQLGFSRLDQVQLLGTSAWSDPELIRLAGPQIEGAVFVDGFFAASPDPRVAAFVSAFQQRFGTLPTLFEAAGYDAANLLLSLLERPENGSREALRRSLGDAQGVPAVAGFVRFGAEGEAEKRLFLLQIQNGTVVQIN